MVEQPGKSNLKIEIHKKVDFEDLHWDCVYERLAVRTKSSGLAIDILVEQFRAQFFGNLRARWVAPADLPQGDNLVLACLCECHGCDEITIERNTFISIGLGRVPLFHSLRFRVHGSNSPALKENTKTGLIARLTSGIVKIGPKRFSVEISSYNTLLLFSALTVLLGALFYALAALLVMHGFAVFLQFLSDPGSVIILATQRADVGIGLISFLVGLAALLGGAVKKILRLLHFSRYKSPNDA